MERQYLDIMQEILDKGDYKPAARENLPGTKELFVRTIRHNLQEGFPLLTTRKIYLRGTFEELKWFLKGSTNVGELIRANCNFWNEDVYKFNRKLYGLHNVPEYDTWLEEVKGGDDRFADGGTLYGSLWRNFNGQTDQICNLINMILKTPNSRYSIVSAWHPTVITNGENALPACHMIWQTNVREGKYLDLYIDQRSCDFPIGVPVNIASYALLIHILCLLLPYEPGELIWTGNSVHIYENQFETCQEQLSREPRELPKLNILVNKTIKNEWTSYELTWFFNSLEFNNLELSNYNPHPKLDYVFSSGLVKKK